MDSQADMRAGSDVVKTHAHHIYGKLGVPGRQRATLRAGELGLL